MTQLIGEVCEPCQLVIPTKEGTYTGTHKGDIWISGGKVWVNVDDTNIEVVTSA